MAEGREKEGRRHACTLERRQITDGRGMK